MAAPRSAPLPCGASCPPSGCPEVCAAFAAPNARRFCRRDLARSLGTDDVERTLAHLVRVGILRAWKAIGQVVFLEVERGHRHTVQLAYRPKAYDSPWARVEAAMDAVRGADPDDASQSRRVRERFRASVFAWLSSTSRGRASLASVFRRRDTGATRSRRESP